MTVIIIVENVISVFSIKNKPFTKKYIKDISRYIKDIMNYNKAIHEYKPDILMFLLFTSL